MGFLNDIITTVARATSIRETAAPLSVDSLRAESGWTTGIRENATGLAQLELEDYMWSPIGGWSETDGISFNRLREESQHCHALYAINPLIKKAVTARTGMIHGRGVRVTAKSKSYTSQIDKIVEDNERVLFGDVARADLEAELSASGNVWIARGKGNKGIRIPMAHISGYITDTDDPSKVLYWHRSYSATTTDFATGNDTSVQVSEYIPAFDNDHPVNKIGQTPVRRDMKMIHIAANRQTTWVLGLPDIFAARFWAKGHKEMYEAGHEYALAQGQFAMQVTGGTGAATQQAAARLVDEPRRDHETGQVYGYGGTFLGSDGIGVQMLGKMGSGVDFKSYDRVTGLVAAATGVPMDVLLASSSSDDVSLEQSTVDDMKLRQKLWTEFYEDFFYGLQPVQVAWPRIKQETVYRVMQSIEIANRSNTLTAEEKRLLAMEAYGLDGNAAEVPDIMEHPDVQVYEAKKKLDLQYAAKIAKAEAKAAPQDTPADSPKNEMQRSTTPEQGNDQGVGKLSDGKDQHDARDAGEQEHTKG